MICKNIWQVCLNLILWSYEKWKLNSNLLYLASVAMEVGVGDITGGRGLTAVEEHIWNLEPVKTHFSALC